MRQIFRANMWVSGVMLLALVFAHSMGLTEGNTLIVVAGGAFVGGIYAQFHAEITTAGYEAFGGIFSTFFVAYGLRFHYETVGFSYWPSSWWSLVDAVIAAMIVIVACLGAAQTERRHKRLAFVVAIPGIGVAVLFFIQLTRWARSKEPLGA